MRSRLFQAHVLGLAILALTALAAGQAGADPAARDKWVSADGNMTFAKLGQLWTVTWQDPAKKTLSIQTLKETKSTDAERSLAHKDAPQFTVTLSAKEAVIAVPNPNTTDKPVPPAGRVKGSWK